MLLPPVCYDEAKGNDARDGSGAFGAFRRLLQDSALGLDVEFHETIATC